MYVVYFPVSFQHLALTDTVDGKSSQWVNELLLQTNSFTVSLWVISNSLYFEVMAPSPILLSPLNQSALFPFSQSNHLT